MERRRALTVSQQFWPTEGGILGSGFARLRYIMRSIRPTTVIFVGQKIPADHDTTQHQERLVDIGSLLIANS